MSDFFAAFVIFFYVASVCSVRSGFFVNCTKSMVTKSPLVVPVSFHSMLSKLFACVHVCVCAFFVEGN